MDVMEGQIKYMGVGYFDTLAVLLFKQVALEGVSEFQKTALADAANRTRAIANTLLAAGITNPMRPYQKR